jgi:predicted acetyltransferase
VDKQREEQRLVEPDPSHEAAFFRLRDEVATAEADFAPLVAVERDGFRPYLARLAAMRDGTAPTKSGVPFSTFWLVDSSGEILAISSVRHRLTPALLAYGGHIGFAVRPSARGRGVGGRTLSSSLSRAAALGIARARLTCDADNVGSRTVIERCGGALDSESYEGARLVRRYWISLG